MTGKKNPGVNKTTGKVGATGLNTPGSRKKKRP